MTTVCLLLVLGCSSGGNRNQARTVSVPDVIGQTQAAAETSIIAAGLSVGTITDQASDTVPGGDVILQNPVANAVVPAGSSVTLVVSTGPATVAIPDVVGQTEAQATVDITTAGLFVGTVTRQNDNTVPVGNVISQSPASGAMVATGSAVDLVVSLGPAMVATPNVAGLSQAQAIADITTAGLVAGNITQQNDNTVPAGDVISQNPAAGAMVAPGSSVDLVISLGPAMIVTPNVVGLSEAQATLAVTTAGLVVGAVTQQADNTAPAGDVIDQAPAGGTMVTTGSAVDLIVSLGPPTVPVPDVVGLSQAQATADIVTAGLSVGTVTQRNDIAVPAGNIISQNPIAGTMVAPGAAIDLVVSLGPGSVSVPDVVNLSLTQATDTLINAGLTVGTVTQQDDPQPAGTVIGQDPLAGTQVNPGSLVNLTVSRGPGTATVPDVVGLTRALAATELGTAGFAVGAVSYQVDNSVPLDEVISQNPPAGTAANLGTSVDLVVSGIAVPDFVGLDQAQAGTDIVAAGLIVGVVSQQNSATVPAGDVISQDPAAGMVLASGSAVNLVVSLGP